MSESSLPDDARLWPKDPYELLGVAPGVSARDLRRAYTRLIRRFKPEQYPEQFRRIREAFETLQRWVPFSPLPSGELETSMDPVADPVSSIPTPDLTLPTKPVPARAPVTDLAALWDRACTGEPLEAYQRLTELAEMQPREDLLLRLYWLLKAAPEVDAARSPCDWLARGLQRGFWHGACRDLYRREVEAHPREALSPRFDRLLDWSGDSNYLLDWYRIRWQAAGRLLNWRIIDKDLTGLHQRLALAQEQLWASLLLTGLDYLAWFSAPAALGSFEGWAHRVHQHEHLHLRMGYAFDRFDLLRDLRRCWQTLADDPLWRPCLRWLPLSWTQPVDIYRRPLMAYLAEALKRPARLVNQFDSLARNWPSLLGQLFRMLEDLWFSGPLRSTPPEDLPGLASEFQRESERHQDPADFRNHVMNFCLREFIPPEALADAVLKKGAVADYRMHEIITDWPLRIVCVAHRAFWQ